MTTTDQSPDHPAKGAPGADRPPEAAPETIVIASTAHVPRLIREKISDLPAAAEPILLAVEGDIDTTGHIVPVWLLATADHVMAVSAAPGSAVRGPYAYRAIADLDIHSTVGSTTLRVFINYTPTDLIRFTNEHRETFLRVLNQLKRLKDGQPLDPEALFAPDLRFCSACGFILRAPGRLRCPRCASSGSAFMRMARLLGGYKGWLVLIISFMVAGIVLDLLPPYLTRILVDEVLTAGGTERMLITIVAILASAAFTRRIIQMLVHILGVRVGNAMTNQVRKMLFQKFQQVEISYYDTNQVGNLMSRTLNDTEQIHGFVTQLSQGFLVNVLLVVGIGVVLFSMNPRLAFYVLIPIPLVVLGTYFFWERIGPMYFRVRDSNQKLSSLLNSVLSGIRLVRVFGQEARETKRFNRFSDYREGARFRAESRVGVFSSSMAFVFGLGGLIIWFVGGRDVLAGQISLGTLMAFLAYIGMFYAPMQQMAMFSNWANQFATSSQRIFEILDAPIGVEDPPDALPCPDLKGAIEMENVWFGYDRFDPVLKGISLRISAGEKIGIVGRSGSGKTTLVNLICRFYDPQQGVIRLDGQDLLKLKRGDVLNQVGLVLQEPFLFRGSIRQNIAYGKPEATMEEIMTAARAAHCHDFILRMSNGYDTWLGERGAGLSGGERQRLSIARALLRNPTLLILDEATSSVDTESEQRIQESLKIVSEGRTVISIAHRLSTLRDADRIYVIDAGRLVESGNHHQLMAKEGTYYRLVRIQTELTRLDLDGSDKQ